MKANKRIRDLRRRSAYRLWYNSSEGARSTTTFPLSKFDKDGSQVRNAVQVSLRVR